MKVAVVIGGVSRNYKENYQDFFKMLNRQDVDIFIATWNIFRNKGNPNVQFDELNRIFNPKRSIMEDYSLFKKEIKDCLLYLRSLSNGKREFSLETGLLAQHYTLKRVFELIEEKYDLVIRYRFDWKPLFVIDFEKIYNLCQEAILYPNQKVNGLKKIPDLRINDLFAISNQENMKVYCSLYDRIIDNSYVDSILKTNCLIPEYLLALHLKTNGVKKNDYHFPYLKLSKMGNRKLGE